MAKKGNKRSTSKLRFIPGLSKPYVDAASLPNCPPGIVWLRDGKLTVYIRKLTRIRWPNRAEIIKFLEKVRHFYPDLRYILVGWEEDLKTGKGYLVTDHWVPGAEVAKGRVGGMHRCIFKQPRSASRKPARKHWSFQALFDEKYATWRNLRKLGVKMP